METSDKNPYGAPVTDAAPNRLGFWATWIGATFRTRAFFSRPASDRSRWGPIGFAVAIGAVTAPAAMLDRVLQSEEPATSAIVPALVALVISPLMTLAAIGFTAAITHVWLVVLGGRHARFGETLACVGYAQAPTLFGIVPVLGAIVGWVWYLAVLVIGIIRVQRTSLLRASIAVVAGPATLVTGALVLRSTVVEAFKLPSGSMLPTLEIGDHLFVNKLAYGARIPLTRQPIFTSPPAYGDVAVFESPEHPEQDFIKRVVGLAGDVGAGRRRTPDHQWLARAELPDRALRVS